MTTKMCENCKETPAIGYNHRLCPLCQVQVAAKIADECCAKENEIACCNEGNGCSESDSDLVNQLNSDDYEIEEIH